MSQELETEINQLLPHRPSIIRVHASHGFAVSKLKELLSREANLGIDLRYVSNQTSLVSLAHDDCDLAGLHVPHGDLRKSSVAATGFFRDIVSGTNGSCAYYCTARRRYDYVTGLGSPLTYRF